MAPYTRRGMVTIRETGLVLTGNSGTSSTLPIFVGHATHAATFLILNTFYRALTRDIFKLHGNNIVDIETDSPGDGWTMNVEYATTTNGAATVISTSTTGRSYEQIALAFGSSFNTALIQQNAQEYIQINEVNLKDANGVVMAKRDYRDATVHCLVKSDLKIQNRTVATGTDEDANSSENIANQPLYGKSYSGKGNGLLVKVDNTTASKGKSLVCNLNGMLAYKNDAANYWLKEPPLPTLFAPRPRYSKASIEPGHVKTSTLVSKMRVKMTDFFNILQQRTAPGSDVTTGSRLQNLYGKFHILALEKMLVVSATDSPPTIGAEVNQQIGLYVAFKRVSDSAAVIENQLFPVPE